MRDGRERWRGRGVSCGVGVVVGKWGNSGDVLGRIMKYRDTLTHGVCHFSADGGERIAVQDYSCCMCVLCVRVFAGRGHLFPSSPSPAGDTTAEQEMVSQRSTRNTKTCLYPASAPVQCLG